MDIAVPPVGLFGAPRAPVLVRIDGIVSKPCPSCRASTSWTDRTMSSRRLSFTEKRRAKLVRSVAQLDRLETRNTITEPISVLGLSLSAFRGLAQIGLMDPNAARNGLSGLVPPAEAAIRSLRPAGQAPTNFIPIEIAASIDQPATPVGGFGRDGSAPAARAKVPAGDWPAAVAPAAAPAPLNPGSPPPSIPPRGRAAVRHCRRAAVPAPASSSARARSASRPYLQAPRCTPSREPSPSRGELRAPFEASNFKKATAFIAREQS